MQPAIQKYIYTTRAGKEIELCQTELTLGQKQDLILVLSDMGLDPDVTDPMNTIANLKIEELFKLLTKNKVLARVMRLIAPATEGDVTDQDYLDMPYSITRKIISDFFLCNAALMSDLTTLLAPIISIPQPAKAAAGRSESSKSFTEWLREILPGTRKSGK